MESGPVTPTHILSVEGPDREWNPGNPVLVPSPRDYILQSLEAPGGGGDCFRGRNSSLIKETVYSETVPCPEEFLLAGGTGHTQRTLIGCHHQFLRSFLLEDDKGGKGLNNLPLYLPPRWNKKFS